MNPSLAVFTRGVLALGGLPTNQTASERLLATYRVTLHPTLTLSAFLHLVQVSVEVTNIAEAVWLVWAKNHKDAV